MLVLFQSTHLHSFPHFPRLLQTSRHLHTLWNPGALSLPPQTAAPDHGVERRLIAASHHGQLLLVHLLVHLSVPPTRLSVTKLDCPRSIKDTGGARHWSGQTSSRNTDPFTFQVHLKSRRLQFKRGFHALTTTPSLEQPVQEAVLTVIDLTRTCKV